jgi:hypothetical protein
MFIKVEIKGFSQKLEIIFHVPQISSQRSKKLFFIPHPPHIPSPFSDIQIKP